MTDAITSELRAQAWRDADAAADRAQVVVRIHRTIDQFEEGCAVYDEVWPTPAGSTEITTALTKVLVHAGGYAAGAYAHDRIIGAALGVVARSQADEGWHTHLHSHVAAVLPGFADRGVGAALKIHQRAWALENDLDRIEWTFDPLVRRNAKFNLAKLGGVGSQYIEDFYGQMSDWISEGAEVAVSVTSSNAPQAHRTSAAIQLVALPEDIVAIRQQDPQAALSWRHAVRDVLAPIITAGGALIGVTQEGDYVVEVVS